MSCQNKPLALATLGLVEERLRLRSATEYFHTVSAAQPRSDKRRPATQEVVGRFVDDLIAICPEKRPTFDALRSATEVPSVAQINALRTLLDLRKDSCPVHPGPPINLGRADLPPEHHVAWGAVMGLAETHDHGWTLVGGQMVHLLAWEHAEESPRTTTDADVVLDVRVTPNALVSVTEQLKANGFDADISADGLGHRYRHQTVQRASVDVMLPEGLRADTFRTADGARTISAAGSTQALEQSMHRRTILGDHSGSVIRPDVFGAIVAKAAAAEADTSTAGVRHLQDFVYLASLHARHYDAHDIEERVSRKDRQRIRYVLDKLPQTSPLWRLDADGRDAYEHLRQGIA